MFMHIKTKYCLLALDKSACSALSNPSAMDCKIKLTFSLLVFRLTPMFKNTVLY